MNDNPAMTPDSIALADRVKQAKRINKIKNTTIADIAGIGRPTVSNQLNGKWNLDVRVLLAVAKLSPNISAEWLLRGEGEMMQSSSDAKGLEIRLSRLEKLLETNN